MAGRGLCGGRGNGRTAGSGPQIVAPVNISGFLTAGDHELALACEGAEVAVYHDGELVTQYTTVVTTGGRAGIGVMDTNPGGQPQWDNFQVASTVAGVNYPISIAGTLSGAGSLSKQVAKSLAGSLTGAGTLIRLVSRRLTGTLAPTASLVKLVSRRLTGTLTASASIIRLVSRRLSGALTSAGAISTSIGGGGPEIVEVGGTLTSAGTIRRLTARGLIGVLSVTGAIARQVTRRITGVLALTATLVKQPARRIGGTVGLSGGLSDTAMVRRELSGNLGLTGTVTKAYLPSMPRVDVGGNLGLSGYLPPEGLVIIRAPLPVAPEAILVAEGGPAEFTHLGKVGAPEAVLMAIAAPPEYDPVIRVTGPQTEDRPDYDADSPEYVLRP